METAEKILESLSYWNNRDLDMLFDAIVSADVNKCNNLGEMKNLTEFQELIKNKRRQ